MARSSLRGFQMWFPDGLHALVSDVGGEDSMWAFPSL